MNGVADRSRNYGWQCVRLGEIGLLRQTARFLANAGGYQEQSAYNGHRHVMLRQGDSINSPRVSQAV